MYYECIHVYNPVQNCAINCGVNYFPAREDACHVVYRVTAPKNTEKVILILYPLRKKFPSFHFLREISSSLLLISEKLF